MVRKVNINTTTLAAEKIVYVHPERSMYRVYSACTVSVVFLSHHADVPNLMRCILRCVILRRMEWIGTMWMDDGCSFVGMDGRVHHRVRQRGHRTIYIGLIFYIYVYVYNVLLYCLYKFVRPSTSPPSIPFPPSHFLGAPSG